MEKEFNKLLFKTTGRACCLKCHLLLFYCLMDLGSWFSSTEACNYLHQMFHIIQCEKPPILSDFYKCIHPQKPDISYFILLCECHCEGGWFTCNPPSLSLISLTAANCKWRTNERNIYKFHGNSGRA